MRTRRISTVAATFGVVAVLAGAGSAQAVTEHSVPFCGSLNPGNGYQGVTLKPGQACTFLPTAVKSIWGAWDVVKNGEWGFGVCVGVLEYPPGWPSGRPLSPTGSGPGNYWGCAPPSSFGIIAQANNIFGAVYGQAVLLNGSTATIVTQPSSTPGNYGRIYYYN